MIHLRAHHVLCLLTYVGKGYSVAFVDNFDACAARLATGEVVVLVAGPDDLCAPVACLPGSHCHEDRVADRDLIAAASIATVLGRPMGVGTRLVLDHATLASLRAAFADGRLRQACRGCPWHSLCGEVAAADFSQARIMGSPSRHEV